MFTEDEYWNAFRSQKKLFPWGEGWGCNCILHYFEECLKGFTRGVNKSLKKERILEGGRKGGHKDKKLL